MLKAIWSYLNGEVRPRARQILTSSQFWTASVLAAAFAIFGADLAIAKATVGQFVTVVLAYAAVAFGFCLAGLTVALTLPDASFTHNLATMKPTAEQVAKRGYVPNAYSDLLFVFSWTAIAHWLVISVGLALLTWLGYSAHLVPDCYSLVARVRTAVFVFVIAYAVMQFLVTMITLSQVGNRYIEQLKERPSPSEAGPSQDMSSSDA